MKRHPCRICLVRACCRRNCPLYETYTHNYEIRLYGIGTLISIIFHIITITLIFNFSDYPRTGLIWYLGIFYAGMYITVLKAKEDYNFKKGFEKFVLWSFSPIWLIAAGVYYCIEKLKIDKYPQKYNPNYIRLTSLTQERFRPQEYEKSEKEKSC